MSMIKYSVGGPITAVKDSDEVENREENNSMSDQMSYVIVCSKCGIQHMILQDESQRTCFCGNVIKLDKMS